MPAGDHVVASSALYGGTYTLLDVTLRRLGIETTFVPADDPAAFAAAIQPGKTKLLYTEIIANPSGTIADLEPLADVGPRGRDPAGGRLDARQPAPLPPARARRRHRAALGDQVPRRPRHLDRRRDRGLGRFPWDNGNFPVMTEPVATYGNLRFWDNFGEYGFATKLRVEGLRNLGGVLSPFNAFLHPAGDGDAAAADGRARRQRPDRGRVPRRPTSA